MGGQNRTALIRDVVDNRGQYATFITLLSAGFVLVTASIIVLQVESTSPDANIKSGGDALWWGLVTITTVGYGDRFPVTLIGRTTAVLVMLAGVGIIGALASILASLLVPDAEPAAHGGRWRVGPGPGRVDRRGPGARSAARGDRRAALGGRGPSAGRLNPFSPRRDQAGASRTSSQSTMPSRFEARRCRPGSHGEAVARSTSRGAVTR